MALATAAQVLRYLGFVQYGSEAAGEEAMSWYGQVMVDPDGIDGLMAEFLP